MTDPTEGSAGAGHEGERRPRDRGFYGAPGAQVPQQPPAPQQPAAPQQPPLPQQPAALEQPPVPQQSAGQRSPLPGGPPQPTSTPYGAPAPWPAPPYGAAGQPPAPYGQPPAPYGQPPAPYGQPPAPYGPSAGQYAPPAAPYAAPRGQYGVPRSRYGQQPPYGAAGQPTGSWAPPRAQRRPHDPKRAISPVVFSADNALTAAIAVVAVVAVQFVTSLVSFLGTISYVPATSTAGGYASPATSFIDTWLFSPFVFYVGAYAMLLFVAPIVRSSSLPVVLLRAVLAGAGGSVLMLVLGVFTGFTQFVRSGNGSYLWTDIFTTPLGTGVLLTALLMAGATVAWLWLGRPRRNPSGPGTPGRVPPADAVPPATIPPNQNPNPNQNH